MKWIFPALFLISIYLTVVVFFIDLFSKSGEYMLLSLAFIFVSSVTNIIYAARCAKKPEDKKNSRKTMNMVMLLFKLLAIPFFVVNFTIFAIFAITPLIFSIWMYYPIIIAATYFLMIVTSSYSIATISLYRKSNLLSDKEFVKHRKFQLIFIVDVIDAIYLFVMLQKKDLDLKHSNDLWHL